MQVADQLQSNSRSVQVCLPPPLPWTYKDEYKTFHAIDVEKYLPHRILNRVSSLGSYLLCLPSLLSRRQPEPSTRHAPISTLIICSMHHEKHSHNDAILVRQLIADALGSQRWVHGLLIGVRVCD